MNNWSADLTEWFSSPLGETVSQAIDEQFAECLPTLWGRFLLQVGCSSEQQWLKHSSIAKQWVLDANRQATNISAVVAYETLPLLADSVDAIVSPFVLEYFKNPDPHLQECDRVLRGGGYLLICGVNPWSLWGLPRLSHKYAHGCPLWQGHLHSANSISRRLGALGYDIDFIRSFFYRPPMTKKGGRLNADVFEQVGKMLWPFPGGFFLLKAQKQRSCPLSVRPLWQWGDYVIGKEFA